MRQKYSFGPAVIIGVVFIGSMVFFKIGRDFGFDLFQSFVYTQLMVITVLLAIIFLMLFVRKK